MSKLLSVKESLTTWAAVAAAGLLIAGRPAMGCGPFFPNTLITGDDRSMVAAPVGDFYLELDRVKPGGAPEFRAVLPEHDQDPEEQSAEIDAAELKSALEAQHIAPDVSERMLSQHRTFRTALSHQSDMIEMGNTKSLPGMMITKSPGVPEGLPTEFAGYLRGLAAYRAGNLAEAQDDFTRVLGLPEDQRHYRSTWAAFMLGKTLMVSEPGRAVPWFELVRAMTRHGLPDRLGLAAASWGWQARAELDQQHYEEAINLYLKQRQAGDPTATMSLRVTIARALAAGPEVAARLAGHATSQRAVTAYLVARGGPVESNPSVPDDKAIRAWLAAVEHARQADVVGADRLAWAAYQAGDMAMARRWLTVTPKDSPVGQWILAKLQFREGKWDQAAATLARVSRLFPTDEVWDSGDSMNEDGMPESFVPAREALGELGVLRLSRRQYTESLDALLRAGFWMDGAYVAERVLTPDELIAYVDRSWPPPTKSGEDADQVNLKIRCLLARRLARIGRWKEARDYFPDAQRPDFDQYIQAIRTGNDHHRTAAERAAALWTAAMLARDKGMELLGTELDPDVAALDGNFTWDLPDPKTKPPGGGTLMTTSDERDRVARHAPEPNKRFHYRYTAADHAWAAADLMPDDSEDTALVLYTAGSWLKDKDPQAADRFYKALVERCGGTALGRAAAQRHWFPVTTAEQK